MGKMALIAVATATLVGGMLLMSMNKSINAAEQQHSAAQEKTLARDAAKTGMSQAKRYVWDQWMDENYSFENTLTGDYQGGNYTIEVSSSRSGMSVTTNVTVTGTHHALGPEGESHVLNATFYSDLADKVPDFMKYAMMSDSTLHYNGTAFVESERHPDGSFPNADVHTNDVLSANGSSSDIYGFGSYVDGKDIRPQGSEDRIFKPKDNEADNPVTDQAAEVEVPTFKLEDYPYDESSTGNVTLGTENVNFKSRGGSGTGDQDNPHIWRINGDLTVNGNVNFEGYGILLVEGNVSITGNASTQQNGEGWLGLYSGGSVNMSGSPRIHGQIFAGGGLTTTHRGTPHLRGNIAVRGVTELNGTVDHTYKKAMPALTKEIWEATRPTGMTAKAYSEW